jgi:hypothetical protein
MADLVRQPPPEQHQLHQQQQQQFSRLGDEQQQQQPNEQQPPLEAIQSSHEHVVESQHAVAPPSPPSRFVLGALVAVQFAAGRGGWRWLLARSAWKSAKVRRFQSFILNVIRERELCT